MEGCPCLVFQLYTVAPPRPSRFRLARAIRLCYHLCQEYTVPAVRCIHQRGQRYCCGRWACRVPNGPAQSCSPIDFICQVSCFPLFTYHFVVCSFLPSAWLPTLSLPVPSRSCPDRSVRERARARESERARAGQLAGELRGG